ncbi:hypothetical protein [Schinkia azotoformans]|uniref:hypothetical protein n=1 Tax=Schinkia azotoformans TaxID=1454 RepID=UPI002DBF1E3D|nr:hypothetical protein [Schinkia azotoformans]MEC1778413.1 hypothetical protein [Schinkia azotoformans]MED4328342.1 hypothetical protein [Schinkia azotoformans]
MNNEKVSIEEVGVAVYRFYESLALGLISVSNNLVENVKQVYSESKGNKDGY